MTTTEISVKMILDRWNVSIKSFDSLLDSITDEALLKEIAPGKNRGIYLLGHMIAVHDDMLILLNMGGKQYTELNEPFIDNADKVTSQLPDIASLRTFWKNQCELMKRKFEIVKIEEWFEKHTAISADDFAKEPHRNKLNIILNRTTHLQYHTGQLILLK